MAYRLPLARRTTARGRTAMQTRDSDKPTEGCSLRPSEYSPNRKRIDRPIGLSVAIAALAAVIAVTLVGCDGSRVTRPSIAKSPEYTVLSTPEVADVIPWQQPDPCTGELVQGTLQARYSADFDDVTG